MVQIAAVTAIAVVVLWAAVAYNRLVTFRNRCRNAWSQVDIQLERRHELIPALADVVRRYASHERETLQRLADARGRAVRAATVPEKGNAEETLDGALSNVFAVAEAYPDLKAHRSFLELQDELRDTEEMIRFSRQFYNDTVMRYNVRLEIFPNVIFARLFGFREADYFQFTTS